MVRICEKQKQAQEQSLQHQRCQRHTAPRRMPEPEIAAEQGPEEQPIRQELVDRVRQQLEAGAYDEEDKLDAILGRLAGDLGVELTDDEPAEARQEG